MGIANLRMHAAFLGGVTSCQMYHLVLIHHMCNRLSPSLLTGIVHQHIQSTSMFLTQPVSKCCDGCGTRDVQCMPRQPAGSNGSCCCLLLLQLLQCSTTKVLCVVKRAAHGSMQAGGRVICPRRPVGLQVQQHAGQHIHTHTHTYTARRQCQPSGAPCVPVSLSHLTLPTHIEMDIWMEARTLQTELNLDRR